VAPQVAGLRHLKEVPNKKAHVEEDAHAVAVWVGDNPAGRFVGFKQP